MLVTYQYHDAKGPIGDWIKKFSDGDLTHVSIRIKSEEYLGTLGRAMSEGFHYDCVWEARFGKKIKPIPREEYEYKDSIVRTITFVVYEKRAIADMFFWLGKQIGKKYDLRGLFAFIWFWVKIRNGRWFCSELATVFLMKFIAKAERYDQKQTPYGFENLALLVKKLYAAQQ